MLESGGYDGDCWYGIHGLLTPFQPKSSCYSRQPSALVARLECVGSAHDLRHLLGLCCLTVCGRTQADKVEACSDSVPLSLAIEIGAGLTDLMHK